MPTTRKVARYHSPASARSSYGAASVTIIAPAKTAAAAKSTSAAAFVSERHKELLAARDEEALQKLADGGTDAFISYAEQRVGLAADDTERAYWQDMLDRAETKNTEASLQAGLKSGEVQLEEALTYLQSQRDKFQPHDSRFGDLTKQISDVKNAISARDFNAELQTAQAKLVTDGQTYTAKKTYLGTLVGLFTRAKDPAAQKTLMTQIQTLQGEMQKDKLLARSQSDNKAMLDYYTGNKTASETIAYLADQVKTAETPQEAAQYTSAVAQIQARERTLTTQKLSAAASSGKSAASVVAEVKTDVTSAQGEFVRTIKAGKPDPAAFTMYADATKRAVDAIEAALPTASAKNATTLLKERDTLLTNLMTHQEQAAAVIVAKETQATTTFNQTLKQLADGGASPETLAQLTAVRAAQIHAAGQSPFMQGLEEDPQIGLKLATAEATVRNKLLDDALTSARIVATDNTPTSKKLEAQYQNYVQFQQSTSAPALDKRQWIDAIKSDPGKVGLSAPADISAAQTLVGQHGLEIQAAVDRHIAAAAPRDATGARFPFVSAPLPGEALRDPTMANLNDPTMGGMIDPGAANQQPLAVSGGSGRPSGASPMPDMTPPPLDEFRQAQQHQPAPASPWHAADLFLIQPTTWDLPTWELPTLPTEPAFTPALWSGGQDYTPPSWASVVGPRPVNDVAPVDIGTYAPPAAPAPAPPPSGGGGLRGLS